jgi:t-SNARE complex subunit (syntaxin)
MKSNNTTNTINFHVFEEKNKVEINEIIIRERNEEIEHIVKDVKEINEIFKDLSKLVNEQSEPILTIEKNINNSHIHTEKAVETLKIAETYNNKWFSKRNKFILLGVAGLSINAPITVVLGIKAGIISSLSTIGLSAITAIFS